MAPGALTAEPTPAPNGYGKAKNADAPRSIFPDGIRTSGQHPPQYELLRPYGDFPQRITGPTIWRREDYVRSPERWTHPFTHDEIQEMSDAADGFIASGAPLTGISKVRWPSSLPRPD